MKANFKTGLKACGKCKSEKPIKEYSQNKHTNDGLQGHCKKCVSEYDKVYDKQYNSRPEVKKHHKEYGEKYHKQYYARLETKIRKKNNNREHRNTPYGLAVDLCSRARHRAQKGNLPFNLTPEYILSVLPAPFVCPLLGARMVRGDNKVEKFSPSLDRIVPERGYVQGNVMVISSLANQIKSTATADEIITVGQNLKKLNI